MSKLQSAGSTNSNLVPKPGENVCAAAMQGRRPYMEDTLLVQSFTIKGKDAIFYGVFDGHGGSVVSKQLVHPQGGLFSFIAKKMQVELGKKHKSLPTLIKEAFVQYDYQMFQRKDKFSAGSTAIVVLIYDRMLYLIKTGDSQGIVFTQDQALVDSRRHPHKPDADYERKRIEKVGHRVVLDQSGMGGPSRVDGILALSRAFGDFEFKQGGGAYLGDQAAISVMPVVYGVDLTPYRQQEIPVYIFLGSDGFWDLVQDDQLSNPELRQLLTTSLQPQQLCQGLINRAYMHGSTDNISVVFDRVV